LNRTHPSPKSLSELPRLIDEASGILAQIAKTKVNERVNVSGVWGGLRGLFAALLARRFPHLLMLVPQAADAEIVAGDARAFGLHDALSLPLSSSDGSAESIHDVEFADRLQILQRLRCREKESVQPLLVTGFIGGALQLVPTPEVLEASTRRLHVGQMLAPEELRRWLAEAGFTATTGVQLAGEFATRGGLLDLFSPDQPGPIRIEWFGDEIESIRRFDLASQRSIESLQSIDIAAIGMTPDDPLTVDPYAEDPFSDDAAVRTPGSQRKNRVERTSEESTSTPVGLGPITDYLPEDTVIVIADLAECRKSAEALFHRLASQSRFVNFEQLLVTFKEHRMLIVSSLCESSGDLTIDLQTSTVDSFANSLDETRMRVDTLAANHDVIVVGDTPADGERLTELLSSTKAASEGRLHLTVGSLSGGFRLVDQQVLVLTSAELFHRSAVRRGRSRSRSRPLDNYLQLEPGDLVVHLSHGIGLYRGLQTIEKNGQQLEHLTIEFDQGAKIYVPASRVGLIQRYVGGTKSTPRLAKIGGQSWAKQKKAVENAVTDMAGELLEIQAARRSRRGIAFDPDNEWQKQFDASFPYTETADQLLAIEASKIDMETPKPMDRLICGDVGFGKTEVAMRAAFKAVISGHQVAVLVPTTVLAEQHFHSFKQRMAEFPVEIAKLSRFCSDAEQRKTIEQLRAGAIDIVVGTHRLASKDIDFANLGLVIVDEEQRFGVAVKERLKTLHSNVDVMTLSATPIPRTLHMALVGVRDISNLETPPAERMAVETRVCRWDEKLIRSAIIRELNRGGQIFFVHNRIGDMHQLADRLQRLVPEVRIGIGHGRLDEDELEQVMVDFIDHKFDMLIATTIVESGLDIPNANTIFIDDADHYGLSDLHQLRGRVGRYKFQAHCYLLIAPHKHLTPDASKRLRAIEEFSHMGAGFAISMRDLEIRGAGNLLGSQQSGHIAAIGYEMYCQLLEDAVRHAQRLSPKLTAEVDIDLPVEAYLPESYVPDLRFKIDLYRRLARTNELGEIHQIHEELIDRFGPPPESAVRLVDLAKLRLEAAAWQIAMITSDPRFIVLHYADRKRVEQLARFSSCAVRIVDRQKAYVPVDLVVMENSTTGQGWLDQARAIFETQAATAEPSPSASPPASAQSAPHMYVGKRGSNEAPLRSRIKR
jgi:transcription-repair coupling factor (superfamily II helicase)